jgi:hypothetical protein
MTTTQNINDMECPQYLNAHCVYCDETVTLDMWALDHNAWAEWALEHWASCAPK